MKRIIALTIATTASCIAFAQTKKAAAPKKPAAAISSTTTTAGSTTKLKTIKDSASYAIGANIARSLKMQNLDNIDPMVLYKGLSDVLLNKKPVITEDACGKTINEYAQKEASKKSVGVKEAGRKFLAENAKKAGVKSMPGGWQYEVLKEGTGTEKPLPTDKVKVHYHGTLIDGTVFDSSVDRGEPMSFGLNQVIKGWTISVSQMTVGSKWRVYLPSELAYGDTGAGEKIPGGSTLIFEIELLGIEK